MNSFSFLFMDTYNKRKRTDQNISDEDQSDNDYSSKTPSENNPQHFPRFIVIESSQEIEEYKI